MLLSQQYPLKRAFITGAASGFGLALCKQLAADGWTLGLTDIDEGGLSAATHTVHALGGVPFVHVFDVADADAFRQAADVFVQQAGGVDLVINNAGIAVAGLLEETTLADWHTVVHINLLGVVHGCHAFVPHLRRAGAGHIINVASIAAVAAGPYMSAYNAAKAGVLSLSETLYSELKAAGVGVSVAMPFFFKTNIARSARGGEAARLMTEKLVENSPVTADEVAAYTLHEAALGTLHILYGRYAKLIWHWKRLFPMHYLNTLVERARHTALFVASLVGKEEGNHGKGQQRTE